MKYNSRLHTVNKFEEAKTALGTRFPTYCIISL